MLVNFAQFVPQKTCLSCQGCCRFKDINSPWRPRLTKKEIKKICFDKIEEERKVIFKEALDGNYIKAVGCDGQAKCTFLNLEDNMCLIYESRPFECQFYPFLLVKKEDRVFIGVHLSCPYIQEKRDSLLFANYLISLKISFQNQKLLDFVKRNSSLFGDYSGYENEIEELFALDFKLEKA